MGSISRRGVLAGGLSLALCPYQRSAAAPADDSDLLADLLARGQTPPARAYAITRALALQSGQRVFLAPGTRIVQRRPGTPIFGAIDSHAIQLIGDGAELWGEGSWSTEWAGNGGHDDHAIDFRACRDVMIDRVTIRNCAHSGIAIFGGTDVRIIRPVIEGTHNYGAPIPYKGNFQMGIYLRHDPLYGAADEVNIEAPEISGTAQGILSELQVGARQPVQGITITDAYIHDITGQHAIYLQAGATSVISPLMKRIALAGVKIQGGDANAVIAGVTVAGAIASDLGSQVFEVIVVPPFTGWIREVTLSGSGSRVGRAIAIGSRVDGLTASLAMSDVKDTGVELSGSDLANIEIAADLHNVAEDGVVVYAHRARNVKIQATVRNPNAAAGATACGVRVESPSAEVTLIDPDVDDSAERMHYGLFNSIAGSRVMIEGQARFTGAAQHAIRATGAITGLPENARLSGKLGSILGRRLVRIGRS